MKVKHVKGSVWDSQKNGEWLQRWVERSGQALPSYCPEKVCVHKPEVGAKVQKLGCDDSAHYIVPLCKKHYAIEDGIIDINDKIALVPASID